MMADRAEGRWFGGTWWVGLFTGRHGDRPDVVVPNGIKVLRMQ